MGENEKCRKAFNFDLVISELKAHYPENHHTKAYKDVLAFMKKYGFEHRQGSGYISIKPLNDVEVVSIAGKLYEELPWFGQCVNKLDVTDIGETYDVAAMFAQINSIENE